MSNNKKSIAGMFAGKGYYIALILCAAAIGISGYLYYHNANANDPSGKDPNQVIDVLNPDGSGTSGSQSGSLTTGSGQPTQPPREPLRTGRPVSGELVVDYAMDCLCYNPTTRDWRTHNGADYAAPAGTAVSAAADGTVYTVYQDETMGMTVVIRHEDGYVTTYSSLAQKIPVAVGDPVKLGQTIGYVGCSAMLESAIGDHVHFTVACNGETMDPEDFFNLD